METLSSDFIDVGGLNVHSEWTMTKLTESIVDTWRALPTWRTEGVVQLS